MTANLTTQYLGLRLANPLVVSACPLAEDLDMLRRLEDAGAAAAVFPSLFEEQIEQEEMEIHANYEMGAESYAEALTYLPELNIYNVGPQGYLGRLEKATRSASIPIIGILNGVAPGSWVRYARLMQDAGAAAVELNIYSVAADLDDSARVVENRYVDVVAAVRQAVSIPLAVKVSPFFSAFANLARRLVEAGANGLVLFNRFVHADIDLDTMRVQPSLLLSTSHESRLPLMWVALLRGRLAASLAASGGVHTPQDVLKLVLAGADVTMMASALYQHGPGHIRTLLNGVSAWIEEQGYSSLEQMKGSMSQRHCPDPGAFERVGYMKTIASRRAPKTRA
jgi:dihydroorotate dehydrogenase (fumarate)